MDEVAGAQRSQMAFKGGGACSFQLSVGPVSVEFMPMLDVMPRNAVTCALGALLPPAFLCLGGLGT